MEILCNDGAYKTLLAVCILFPFDSSKDKVHEGVKSALLQKLMKFGNIIYACLR